MAARVPGRPLKPRRRDAQTPRLPPWARLRPGTSLRRVAVEPGPWTIRGVGQQVRRVYGASMSPDATAFAHLVDDGGFPRAVQRFLRGWR
ncbi:hypothetical protein ABQF26_36290, partial [Mycolicibacterium elephantis]